MMMRNIEHFAIFISILFDKLVFWCITLMHQLTLQLQQTALFNPLLKTTTTTKKPCPASNGRLSKLILKVINIKEFVVTKEPDISSGVNADQNRARWRETWLQKILMMLFVCWMYNMFSRTKYGRNLLMLCVQLPSSGQKTPTKNIACYSHFCWNTVHRDIQNVESNRF